MSNVLLTISKQYEKLHPQVDVKLNFGSSGALKRQIEKGAAVDLFFTLIFSYGGAVVAAAVVAFPLIYQTFKTGFESLDSDVESAARCDGANGWQVFRYIHLPLTKKSFAAATILGFTRSLGEFGATLLVAGNIPGQTQTIPTAMYIAIESGQDRLALLWALCSTALSFLLLLMVNHTKSKQT
jgi:molybdate transport system permease protein